MDILSKFRFDETFDMILPTDLVDFSSGFVHLCVKDRGVMGEGIFLGEAYLPLKSIEQTDMDIVLEVWMQIRFLVLKLVKNTKFCVYHSLFYSIPSHGQHCIREVLALDTAK